MLSVVQSRERRGRASGQCRFIIAMTWSLPCMTSIVTDVTPRTWAPAIKARTSAEPTPRRCQTSATTTPMSVVRDPPGPGRSAAMPCPMMAPSRVARIASVVPSPPASSLSRVGPGAMEEKNLR